MSILTKDIADFCQRLEQQRQRNGCTHAELARLDQENPSATMDHSVTAVMHYNLIKKPDISQEESTAAN
ncbi:MAG: hypothetical protein F6K00_24450 [Leptolyngbya sp. SIOISBB]|nr:hypothetical protein [Leptolyngbya sp. SIOISBB]